MNWGDGLAELSVILAVLAIGLGGGWLLVQIGWDE